MIPLEEIHLEEVSNRNLVSFFVEELTQGVTKDNTSHGARRQLKTYGILKRGRGRLTLTEYGERLLEEVKNE